MYKNYILICLCFLAACSYSKEWKQVTVKGQYSLSFPDYMEEYTERKINAKASLQYLNFFRNIYSLVIVEDKRNSQVDLTTYCATAKKELVDLMKQPQQIDSTTTQINGLKAVQLSLAGVIAGAKDTDTRIYYKLIFFESETHIYQLVLWTWDSWREKYMDDMKKIIHSFKEL